MSVAISGSTPLPSLTPTSAKDAKSGGADQDAAPQVSSQSVSTNPDGSTVTTIVYADGTTATTTQAAPPAQQAAAKGNQPTEGGPGAKGNLLDSSNVGQTATLLAAQEKAAQSG
ncbi:MAG: hypothetical protein WCC64_09725 [Aliidongia sp.]|jgi:hypothetical protein